MGAAQCVFEVLQLLIETEDLRLVALGDSVVAGLSEFGSLEYGLDGVNLIFVAFFDHGANFIGSKGARVEGADVESFLFDGGEGREGDLVDFALLFEADEFSLAGERLVEVRSAGRWRGYLSHGAVRHEFHGERLLGCAMENTDVLIGPTFAVEHGVGFAGDEAWSC